MLKNRLIFLTDQAKKYILLGVLFRELALIAQIVSVFQIGDILYATIRQTMTNQLSFSQNVYKNAGCIRHRHKTEHP